MASTTAWFLFPPTYHFSEAKLLHFGVYPHMQPLVVGPAERMICPGFDGVSPT